MLFSQLLAPSSVSISPFHFLSRNYLIPCISATLPMILSSFSWSPWLGWWLLSKTSIEPYVHFPPAMSTSLFPSSYECLESREKHISMFISVPLFLGTLSNDYLILSKCLLNQLNWAEWCPLAPHFPGICTVIDFGNCIWTGSEQVTCILSRLKMTVWFVSITESLRIK